MPQDDEKSLQIGLLHDPTGGVALPLADVLSAPEFTWPEVELPFCHFTDSSRFGRRASAGEIWAPRCSEWVADPRQLEAQGSAHVGLRTEH
jgi:hypothetical protein